MLKQLFIIIGLLFVVPSLFAQPAPRPLAADLVERLRVQYGFSAEDCDSLRATGGITRFQDKDFSSLILPDKPLAARLKAELKELPATVLVESLFVIPMEKGLTGKEDFRLAVYNTLHKIDKMKGLMYWSETDQRMQVLFKESYMIADPDSRTPLPNPVSREIPDQDLRYVYQKDSRFGENTYRAEFGHYDGIFRITMLNLTKIYYGFIPLVQKEKMRLDMVILFGEDHLIFYSCIGADALTLFGFEKRILPSFSNRSKALFSWFQENL